jgi:ketosteroid isomerase-like protein
MHRSVFALPLLLACAGGTSSRNTPVPGPSPYAAREGDTVLVLMHRVRPDKRADYERFMTDVWYPRARKYGARQPGFGAALNRRWRLVGTDPGQGDSLYTYMFLYPPYEPIDGASEMWRQIGVPEEQIAQDSSTQNSLVEIFDGFAAVRREYAGPGSASADAAPRPGDKNSEEQTIRGLEATWRAALSAKDTAAVRRFYADGAYYLPDWSTGYSGPDAITDRWAGEFSGGEFHLEREPKTVEVAGAGDMAYEVGTYRVSWNKPDRGDSGGGTGNYVTVWKKVAGEWKTAAYIWNQDARR